MKQEWSTEKFTSGFAAAISSIPAGRLRLTPPNFMKKAAACSRVWAGIYSPVAGRTRKDIESQSDTPVITAKNAAQLNQVVTDLLEGAVSDTTEESKDK